MAHGHHQHRNERRSLIALLLVGVFLFVEIAGGLLSGSLALLADAGHMATDAASLLLAWSAFRLSRRPHDAGKSFGYYRFEVIAAFINGLALLLLVGWIVYEAIMRIKAPTPVLAGPMLAIAVTGLLVNLLALAALHGADRDNLNIRGALLHVVGDILGSLAAIVAALVILKTGWMPIDPLLSLLVAALLVRAGWSLIRRTVHILMEGSPDHIDEESLKRGLIAHVPGLVDVHHLHIWLLTAERPLLTAHLKMADTGNTNAALAAAKTWLAREYGISHSTLQIEIDRCPG